jgi:hypothetical protein
VPLQTTWSDIGKLAYTALLVVFGLFLIAGAEGFSHELAHHWFIALLLAAPVVHLIFYKVVTKALASASNDRKNHERH